MEPPIYRIVVGDDDITAKVQDRLMSLKIHDAPGVESDTVTIELDNRDEVVRSPSTGAALTVSIGTGKVLVPKGIYEVVEVEESLDNDDLIIHATAAKFKGSIKSPKDRTFDDITFGDLVGLIANENQLQEVINDELGAIHFDHIDQKAESDLNLLTRLGRQYGAIAKPVAGRLLVTKKGEGKTASGNDMPLKVLPDPEHSGGRVVTKERDNYQSAVAHWFDEVAQQKRQVKVGKGEPVLTIRQEYNSEAEAKTSAEAELAERQRGKKTLSLSRPLTPDITAESRVQLLNHKSTANGFWIVESADHVIRRGNVAETTAELVTPN